jgi:hypothetical protein
MGSFKWLSWFRNYPMIFGESGKEFTLVMWNPKAQKLTHKCLFVIGTDPAEHNERFHIPICLFLVLL